MLQTVLNIIMFEDCRNQWSMSRPLLGLILLNEEVGCSYAGRSLSKIFLYPPQTLFVGGILFSRCPSVRASVTLCFLNNSEESLPDFHQTLQTCSYMQDKYFRQKSRARGQFY